MTTLKSFRSNLVLVAAAAALFVLPGCFNSAPKKPTIVVANVLDKSLFDDARVPGSVHVPYGEHEASAVNWDKNAPVVVYCSNYRCTASGSVAKKLMKLGFTNVMAYEEGMVGWYQANQKDAQAYPVEGACQQEYLKSENEKPEGLVHDDALKVITTEELRALLVEKGILK